MWMTPPFVAKVGRASALRRGSCGTAAGARSAGTTTRPSATVESPWAASARPPPGRARYCKVFSISRKSVVGLRPRFGGAGRKGRRSTIPHWSGRSGSASLASHVRPFTYGLLGPHDVLDHACRRHSTHSQTGSWPLRARSRLSVWLSGLASWKRYHAPTAEEVPAICIETRHA